MHVAGMPGHLYNPLFIYGGVGLGKTHLMHAVGNQLISERSGAKVLYIHAEQFVTDVVKAYQRKAFDEFKERYHTLDLLLIDDVQFLANKERTQEEFFNAFEALLARKSHIVMTSDTYPKGLADIHERLVSRFDSGLTVAIEPPELEMRVAILINKALAEARGRAVVGDLVEGAAQRGHLRPDGREVRPVVPRPGGAHDVDRQQRRTGGAGQRRRPADDRTVARPPRHADHEPLRTLRRIGPLQVRRHRHSNRSPHRRRAVPPSSSPRGSPP